MVPSVGPLGLSRLDSLGVSESVHGEFSGSTGVGLLGFSQAIASNLGQWRSCCQSRVTFSSLRIS